MCSHNPELACALPHVLATSEPPGDSSANRLSGTNIKGYIFGFDGADKLYGMEGDDDLFGGAGDDLLDGGWGADRMFGGAGNDTYIVDNLGDQVLESSSSDGNDVVRASVDFILPSFVEELAFSGRSSINGTGNDLPNKIIGNGAANILNGGAGADMLTGGNGPDTFVFVRGEAAGDVVTNFDGNGPRAGDTLRFEGYGPGATFTKQDATHWVISSGDGQTQETINLANGASVHATEMFGAGHGGLPGHFCPHFPVINARALTARQRRRGCPQAGAVNRRALI